MPYLPVTCTGRAPPCDYRHVAGARTSILLEARDAHMPRRPVLAAVTALSVAVSTALLGAGGASAAPPPTGTGFEITKPARSDRAQARPLHRHARRRRGRHLRRRRERLRGHHARRGRPAQRPQGAGEELPRATSPRSRRRWPRRPASPSTRPTRSPSTGSRRTSPPAQAAELLADRDVVSVVAGRAPAHHRGAVDVLPRARGPRRRLGVDRRRRRGRRRRRRRRARHGHRAREPRVRRATRSAPRAGAEPYLDGDSITFQKADGSVFRGVCETGEQFTADDCSTKIIGARYFVDGLRRRQPRRRVHRPASSSPRATATATARTPRARRPATSARRPRSAASTSAPSPASPPRRRSPRTRSAGPAPTRP